MYPITIYFIGAYLKEYGLKISKKISLVILGILIILSGVFNCYRSYKRVFFWGTWTNYNSVIVIVMAMLVFHIIVKTERLNRLPCVGKKILRSLSKGAFGAYLLSYIFDSILYPYLKEMVYDFSHMFEYFFVCVPLVFACSMLGSWILNFVYEFIQEALRIVIRFIDMYTKKKHKKLQSRKL